jgi:hypothetical protein
VGKAHFAVHYSGDAGEETVSRKAPAADETRASEPLISALLVCASWGSRPGVTRESRSEASIPLSVLAATDLSATGGVRLCRLVPPETAGT